jgi:ABC-type antimicrobial peptide transport system permease subunit
VLNGHPQTVVGVAPQDFQWFIKDGSLTGAKPQMWSPFVFPQSFSNHKGMGRFITVVARLKPGATPPQAQTKMNAIASRLEQEYPDPLALVSAARGELQKMDPQLPMAAVATMDQLLADSLSRSRFTMLLLGIFAAVALVLAAVGIYGLIAYSVTQRTQELGVRIALGAQRRDVLRLVLAQGTRLTLLGVALGVFAALALSRLLATLLFAVSATDPLTFAGVAALLALVALLACFIPARRATRVDPIVALRYE